MATWVRPLQRKVTVDRFEQSLQLLTRSAIWLAILLLIMLPLISN